MPIDMLPDDALLAIFYFYVKAPDDLSLASKEEIEVWQTLVHVCQRWRNLVLGSPRRLNLRLVGTYRTPARTRLMSGRPCRFTFAVITIAPQKARMTSWLHSGTAIAFVKSSSDISDLGN